MAGGWRPGRCGRGSCPPASCSRGSCDEPADWRFAPTPQVLQNEEDPRGPQGSSHEQPMDGGRPLVSQDDFKCLVLGCCERQPSLTAARRVQLCHQHLRASAIRLDGKDIDMRYCQKCDPLGPSISLFLLGCFAKVHQAHGKGRHFRSLREPSRPCSFGRVRPGTSCTPALLSHGINGVFNSARSVCRGLTPPLLDRSECSNFRTIPVCSLACTERIAWSHRGASTVPKSHPCRLSPQMPCSSFIFSPPAPAMSAPGAIAFTAFRSLLAQRAPVSPKRPSRTSAGARGARSCVMRWPPTAPQAPSLQSPAAAQPPASAPLRAQATLGRALGRAL